PVARAAETLLPAAGAMAGSLAGLWPLRPLCRRLAAPGRAPAALADCRDRGGSRLAKLGSPLGSDARRRLCCTRELGLRVRAKLDFSTVRCCMLLRGRLK